MAKIILISCVSKKQDKKARAEDIYISPLFRFNLGYARSMNPDKIFILSAKHGLLHLDQQIEPYNQTLNNMKSAEIKAWAKDVIEKLSKEADLHSDEFVFLAGQNYRKYLVEHIKKYKVPMEGLGIGKQLRFLKDAQNAGMR